MSIIDEVKREEYEDRKAYEKTLTERLEQASELAKNRIISQVKNRIKYGPYSCSFTGKRYVIIEMPPVEIQSHMVNTPIFSSSASDNHVDCYYVRTATEREQFLSLVRLKLQKEGVTCTLKASKYGNRAEVLQCKYSWR